jgi:hypothetical protein
MFDDSLAAALAYTDEKVREFGYVTDADLNVRWVRGAVLTPREHPTNRTFTGAVHDASGQLIASSQRHNPGDIVPADPLTLGPQALQRAAECRFGTALYGGILFPILGHFLMESLARLWPLLCVAPCERRVCFHPWPGLEIDAFFSNPLYVAALRALGLARDNILVIQQDCSVDTLLLPTLMATLADHVSAAIAEPASAARPTPHIYLSRSRWSENTRICNESAIDDWADRRGFRVVHPQDTPPGTLLRLLTQAETVVASDGSHAHLALFCRPGTRVLMLDTRPVPTQFALAKLRRFRTLHLPLSERLGYDPDQRTVDAQALGPLMETALAQLYA